MSELGQKQKFDLPNPFTNVHFHNHSSTPVIIHITMTSNPSCRSLEITCRPCSPAPSCDVIIFLGVGADVIIFLGVGADVIIFLGVGADVIIFLGVGNDVIIFLGVGADVIIFLGVGADVIISLGLRSGLFISLPRLAGSPPRLPTPLIQALPAGGLRP